MKALQLNAKPYLKLVLVLCVMMVLAILTGMTESKMSYDLLQILPPDLSSLQGHNIFARL